ncbi:MAG: acetylxylan esterase [Planctomycetaceae bacterium]|nr:acetylxylan esterase [Planctomycetaceae bacterium]
MARFGCLASVVLALVAAPAFAVGDPTDVVPADRQLNDRRMEPLKDLNGVFSFDVPDTQAAWEQRAEDLRRRVLVATDLWPQPMNTPLNPVIHGKGEREGFTVEKVYFESIPGFYVTGLLFRPAGKDGPFPAVLCPHGHGGRLMDAGPDRIKQQIEKGEEKFESSGRFPKIARCAQLARMGCVVFMYDMLGYADSQQISYELAHRFAKQRPELDTPEKWGFFSTQAELRLQSIMGVQTWNSIRCLDFLCDLPDVDSSRIGVTGGSGGGTQTILLCAIDPRPIVAFPQGMVSTSMQGGCTCENCSLLRIGTGNVELAGLFAPKPQAMTAADDWTKNMMNDGFPALQQLYGLYGAKELVDCKPYLHFPHNYNYVTRNDMYHWFNTYLKLDQETPIIEEDFPFLTSEEHSVWTDDHPAPKATGEEFEVQLLQQLAKDSDEQMAAFAEAGNGSAFRTYAGDALKTLIGRTPEQVGPIDREKVAKVDKGSYWLFHDIITATQHGEQLPVVSLYPKGRDWNGQVVLWLSGQGKSTLFANGGALIDQANRLVEAGCAIVTADLFSQGEFLEDERLSQENRVVENPREFAGYTYAYNHPLFAQRVHDVLTLLAWIHNGEHEIAKLTLVGTEGAAPIALAAAAISTDGIQQVAVDLDQFRFTQLDSYRHEHFLPGIVKYGDIPGLVALASRSGRQIVVVDDQARIPSLTKAVADDLEGNALSWRGSQKSLDSLSDDILGVR